MLVYFPLDSCLFSFRLLYNVLDCCLFLLNSCLFSRFLSILFSTRIMYQIFFFFIDYRQYSRFLSIFFRLLYTVLDSSFFLLDHVCSSRFSCIVFQILVIHYNEVTQRSLAIPLFLSAFSFFLTPVLFLHYFVVSLSFPLRKSFNLSFSFVPSLCYVSAVHFVLIFPTLLRIIFFVVSRFLPFLLFFSSNFSSRYFYFYYYL